MLVLSFQVASLLMEMVWNWSAVAVKFVGFWLWNLYFSSRIVLFCQN